MHAVSRCRTKVAIGRWCMAIQRAGGTRYACGHASHHSLPRTKRHQCGHRLPRMSVIGSQPIHSRVKGPQREPTGSHFDIAGPHATGNPPLAVHQPGHHLRRERGGAQVIHPCTALACGIGEQKTGSVGDATAFPSQASPGKAHRIATPLLQHHHVLMAEPKKAAQNRVPKVVLQPRTRSGEAVRDRMPAHRCQRNERRRQIVEVGETVAHEQEPARRPACHGQRRAKHGCQGNAHQHAPEVSPTLAHY